MKTPKTPTTPQSSEATARRGIEAAVEEFLTGDLGQAALLVAKEVPLLAVRSNGRHAVFVFPATAKPLAEKFFQPGGDLVSARKFHMSLRDLRGLAREAVK